MHARRIAIMLLLTALTALTLFVVLLLDEPAFAAAVPAALPDTLEAYVENVTVGDDGDATVSVTAVVGRVSSMDLLLPWHFAGGRGHQIVRGAARFAVGPAGEPAPLVEVLGQTHWNLRLLPGAAPGDTVVLVAEVPGWYDATAAPRQFGVRRFDRTWVNTSRFVLRHFSLGLELPRGLLVDAVGATTPSFSPSRSPQPPYAVGRVGSRGTFAIAVAPLPPAGRAAFTLDARPTRRGPVPLAAGLVLSALYLVFYRDVLSPARRQTRSEPRLRTDARTVSPDGSDAPAGTAGPRPGPRTGTPTKE